MTLVPALLPAGSGKRHKGTIFPFLMSLYCREVMSLTLPCSCPGASPSPQSALLCFPGEVQDPVFQVLLLVRGRVSSLALMTPGLALPPVLGGEAEGDSGDDCRGQFFHVHILSPAHLQLLGTVGPFLLGTAAGKGRGQLSCSHLARTSSPMMST